MTGEYQPTTNGQETTTNLTNRRKIAVLALAGGLALSGCSSPSEAAPDSTTPAAEAEGTFMVEALDINTGEWVLKPYEEAERSQDLYRFCDDEGNLVYVDNTYRGKGLTVSPNDEYCQQ